VTSADFRGKWPLWKRRARDRAWSGCELRALASGVIEEAKPPLGHPAIAADFCDLRESGVLIR